ncbi:cystatin C (amyloid angiopathy and cerebral hemorrhage) [Labrus mixtus]|uniref:cystatin C (amyloid angiopathy and cerebral hemorrhage) n=1 Tax=Labrus mixtus TaxID=508554 RepID=UPI0029C0A4DB|nr:cystatin C (amyloid angiopathy and cerebral hemorrhage) [Labrus mixtus]
MWKVVLPLLAAVFSVGSVGLIGGPTDISASNEGAVNALNFAVIEHNRQSNGMFLTKPQEVIKVQRQMVAGFLYIITVKMAKTPCRKSAATELCAIHEDPAKAQAYQCTFKVWDKPWTGEIKLTEQTCT